MRSQWPTSTVLDAYGVEMEVCIPPRKEEAACCAATVDAHGRPCIGYCGPTCERRP